MVGRLCVPEPLHINGKYKERTALCRGIQCSYLYLHIPQETKKKICCYCPSVASNYYNNRFVCKVAMVS